MIKRLIVPAFGILFIVSCQNSNKSTGNDQAQQQTAVPEELKVEPAAVKEASEKAAVSYQKMTDLAQSINDALKQKMSDSQVSDIETIRHQLDDVMTKQETMMKGLAAANSAGGNESNAMNNQVPPPGVLKDYVESINNYDKFVDDLKSQLEAAKNKKQ